MTVHLDNEVGLHRWHCSFIGVTLFVWCKSPCP